MNKIQKLVLLGTVALAMISGIFPPWIYTYNTIGDGAHMQSEKPGGYGFIFSPPPPEKANLRFGIRLDYVRLLIQWAMLFIVGSIMIWVLKEKRIAKPTFKSDTELLENLSTAIKRSLLLVPEKPGWEKGIKELQRVSILVSQIIPGDISRCGNQLYNDLELILGNALYRRDLFSRTGLDVAINDWMTNYSNKKRAL